MATLTSSGRVAPHRRGPSEAMRWGADGPGGSGTAPPPPPGPPALDNTRRAAESKGRRLGLRAAHTIRGGLVGSEAARPGACGLGGCGGASAGDCAAAAPPDPWPALPDGRWRGGGGGAPPPRRRVRAMGRGPCGNACAIARSRGAEGDTAADGAGLEDGHRCSQKRGLRVIWGSGR